MDSSALAVIIFGTLLFIGFAVWMAFYSRRVPIDNEAPGERTSQQGSEIKQGSEINMSRGKDIGRGRLEKG